METVFLNDKMISKALSNLIYRADKQTEDIKMAETFVDIGLLERIDNNNNQIIFGRRGTGKTHLLKKLHFSYRENEKYISSYIDCRKFGSVKENPSKSLQIQLYSIFRDLFSIIYSDLAPRVLASGLSTANENLQLLENSIYAPQTKIESQNMNCKQTLETTQKRGATSEIGVQKIGFLFEGSKDNIKSKAVEQNFNFNREDILIISDINSFLQNILSSLDCKLVILIDEWSELFPYFQPYFADLLKRCFFANSNIVIKIAAIEYRSRFCLGLTGSHIGFELGCDISTIDLDSFFVFDKNSNFIIRTFEKILFKHLISELPPNYLQEHYSIKQCNELISLLFTTKKAFEELVMASEGIVRDFISISVDCFYSIPRDAAYNRTTKIGAPLIRKCAAQLYTKEKDSNLPTSTYRVLTRIIHKVIGEKHARSFMVLKKYEKHPVLMELFDSRVIHLIKTSYSDRVHAGERYSVFTLDYGTYVDLITRKNGQALKFGKRIDKESLDQYDFMVPMEDNRSIRTIILDPRYITRELLDEEMCNSKETAEEEYRALIRNASLEYKLQVVELYMREHKSFDEIFEMFGVKETEVKKWANESHFNYTY